ncbi:MAG: hypothetical protein JWM56_443 [Candidatus Peribacteria bacterium]|nr:hypothetical protein [Candidatus Peribacteria bacterium]
MFRRLSAFGLLLFLPVQVAFATQSDSYATQVLDRADQSMAYIDSQEKIVSFFQSALPSWTRSTFSALSDIVDTDLLVNQQQRDLLEFTPCLHTDAALIEAKIVEVQKKLVEANDARDAWRILQYKSLIVFLRDRIAVLLRGAVDPAFKDPDWTAVSTFEPLPEADLANVCPFDSDYLPPSLGGYGCDIEAIDAKLAAMDSSLPALKDTLTNERQSLTRVQAAANQYYAQSQSIRQIQNAIDAVVEGKPVPATSVTPVIRTHKRVLGCEVPGCLQDGSGCRAMTGALFTTLRGPFSLERNELTLLSNFRRLRKSQAEARPPSDLLAVQPVDPNGYSLDSTFGSIGRNVFKDFSVDIADQETLIFALGADSSQRIGAVLTPVRDSIERLARLVYPKASDAAPADTTGNTAGGASSDSKIVGLRAFVRDFAYFLRRSCLERPCNERLDRVLKIVFQDACFPYTKGTYLTEDEKAACVKAAGL